MPIDPETERKLAAARRLIERAMPHPRDTGAATLDDLRTLRTAAGYLHDAIKHLAEQVRP